MAKDLNIAKSTAEKLGVELPAFNLMQSLYKQLSQDGEYKDKDFGVIYKMLEEKYHWLLLNLWIKS